jgi:tetratricopeptide (TPR) repeat protein
MARLEPLSSALGYHVDPVVFWATLFVASCVIVIATAVHILLSLNSRRLRRIMEIRDREVMRRDMDRIAEYLDELPRSSPAVRQPFELGLAAMEASDWNRAVGHFREAMLQARGAEIVALFNLTGMCRYTQGLLDDALKSFEEALRLAEQFEDEDGKAPALGNIGVIWHDRGDLDRALQYKEQALAKAHQLGDQWAEAIYLANIGNIWHDKAELDKALGYHEQAFELSRELGDKWGVATDLASIASIFRDKGGFDEALQYNREALAIARKIGHRLGVVTDLGNISGIYRYKGKLDEALKYGEQALTVARKVGYQSGVATDLGNIGLILADKRKYAQAVPKLAEALAILLATGVADGPRQVLSGLIRCENKLSRKRMEQVLKGAGLDDRGVADVLERIDQVRQKKPRPRPKRRVWN